MKSPSDQTEIKCSRGLSPLDRLYANLGREFEEYYLLAIEQPLEAEKKLCRMNSIVECVDTFSEYSPIEQILFSEILFMTDGFTDIVLLEFPEGYGDFITWVSPQYTVGKYTVDFMFQVKLGDKWKRIVVECDGHEFHEKTKKQAAHDKKRDRFFARQDFMVLRFTGSEIYNDPVGCKEEIEVAIHSAMDIFVMESIRGSQ